MNTAQIHLALNHAPLILSIAGGIILLVGIIRKNESFKTLSLIFLIAGAAFTAPVFLTGEGTEVLTEHLPGVNETAIEKHESWAKISLIIIVITGVTALAALFFQRKGNMFRLTSFLLLCLSVVAFGSMAQTAHLGGLIRHSEITANTIAGNEDAEKEEEEEEEKTSVMNGPVEEMTGTSDSLKATNKKLRKEDDDD